MKLPFDFMVGPASQAKLDILEAFSKAYWGGATTYTNWLRDTMPVATGALPDTMHKQLAFAHQVGMPILMGTDGGDDPLRIAGMPPGFALHAELTVFVMEGLTPLEALQSATINPARALRVSDSLGTVTAGKLADLILLNADPLVDIGNTTAIQAVVANGRYYDRAALDKILADVQQLPKPMYPTKRAP